MVEQVIVSNGGEVGKLEIVDIGGIAFLYLLLDIGIYHCKDFPEPGVPSTMEARKGFTTLIQPLFHFLP